MGAGSFAGGSSSLAIRYSNVSGNGICSPEPQRWTCSSSDGSHDFAQLFLGALCVSFHLPGANR